MTQISNDSIFQRADCLEWVLRSPNLLAEENSFFKLVDMPGEQDIRHVLKIANSKLDEHLSKEKSHFLGAQLESYWRFYLHHCDRYELIDHNIQFNAEGRTLGEIDFLVFDHQEQVYKQQELAVKYYLCSPKEHLAYKRWVGPNSIDRFDLKLSKLKDHQLKLSEHLVVKKYLQSRGIGELKGEVLLKGYLFENHSLRQTLAVENSSPNEKLNSQHLKGSWFYYEQFFEQLTCGDWNDLRFQILERSDWMTDAKTSLKNTLLAEKLMTASELQTQVKCFLESGRATMIGMYEVGQQSQLCQKTRAFLVPKEWPNI